MMAELGVVFVNEPSQHLMCPVCKKLYQDPVINIVCGHTFCKLCGDSISACPLDGKQCDKSCMVVNRLVVGQIDDLLIYCKYGLTKDDGKFVVDPCGCQQQISLGTRASHEDNCEFRTAECPNKNCDVVLRQRELNEHSKICNHNTCSHEFKGCDFKGRREDVLTHETTCGYRALPASNNNSQMQEQTERLETRNEELQKQVTTLNMRVGQLEESNTSLQGQLQECLRAFRDLNQKYETVLTSLDQLVTVRNRRSLGSPGHTEMRSRSSSSSSLSQSLSGSPPNSVKHEKWSMPFQFKCIGTLRGHQDTVWCLTNRKSKLFSAGADCSIKVWDLDNLQRGCIRTIQGHSKAIQCMCIGGELLFTGGHDNSIFSWNLTDYEMVKCVQNAHDNIICAMVYVGGHLFTSSFSLIKVWEAKMLQQKDILQGLHHWVRALALNPDRDKLYSGSHNTIYIWSVQEPFSLKGKVDHQFGSVYSLAVTSRYIIAGTYNQNLQVFDGGSFEHVRELMGHIGMILSITSSPTGRFLFSASQDKSIQIWNLENMLPIQTLKRHEGSVNSLLVHGNFLFSASEDKEIKVFMYFQMQMGFSVNA